MPITRFQIQSGFGAAQVGLGFPAAAAAAGGGYVSPSTVNASLDCLAKRARAAARSSRRPGGRPSAAR